MNRIVIFFSLFLIAALATNSCDYTNYKQGKLLYESNCATCHMTDGSGVARLYPSLRSDEALDFLPEEMPCIIRYGQNKDAYSLAMVGISDLTDIEINNIINYILNDLNDMEMEYRIDQTRKLLENCNTGE